MEYAQRREGYYEEEAEEMIGEIDMLKFHGQDGGETSHGCTQKEHMFDKVVTPSDVGKLNRLVIPKQHAEKYFPLDSSVNEKGLLLNFEDRSGKPWRFRYSYWSSSQSYVMTKGWSRFVKEKKLDAGDIVSFERGIGELEKDHLYIDWRRKPNAPDPRTTMLPSLSLLPRPLPWGRFFVPQSHGSYGYNVVNPCSGSIFCLSSITAPQQVGGEVPTVFNSVPVVHAKATARKRVRLFGVNLDCPIQEDTECDILSSTTISHSGSSLLPLQLRPSNGSPLPTEFPKKGKPSIPFNFDM